MKRKFSPAIPVKVQEKDMLESCNASPWFSVGKILPISTEAKEDVFASYRPNRQCVDYKISETWIKMQRGDLKVNVRQTGATYEDIPPEICKPQKKKKVKKCKGGPPQYKFLNEVWSEVVHRHQIHLKNEHNKKIRHITIKRKKEHLSAHQEIQELVGPEWFMELSPKQLAAAEKLELALFCDIRNRTIINCQEILAVLGLVLRPNHKHVEIAIKHSCGSPTEFLLVLYQLIDPKRTQYSLNDRLLLSAVVHLSIVPTLRELHIRIPSPPKRSKKIKPAKKKEKRQKYESPYLEPQTFEPAPPKFSGIYKDKHKQYPVSKYFAYMDTLEEEKRNNKFYFNPTSTNNKQMGEIVKEYNNAQDFYETLPGIKKAMLRLIPPTELMLCPNMLHRQEKPPIDPKLIPPHLCKVTSSEPLICFCKENRMHSEKKVKRSRCEKYAQKLLKELCPCEDCIEEVRQKNLIRVHGGFQMNICKCVEPVPLIQGTLPSTVCDCYEKYRNKIIACAARQKLADQELKYILGEVVMTKFGPIFKISGVPGPKICNCGDIKERKTQIKKAKETLLKYECRFVNGGVTISKFGPIYSLNAVVARRSCKCVIKYRQQLKVLELQNTIREHPVSFVNNGLISGKFGPIFYFSGVPDSCKMPRDWPVRTVCSCEIRKAACFDICINHLEYKDKYKDDEEIREESTTDENTKSSDEDELSSSEESTSISERFCAYCTKQQQQTQLSQNKGACCSCSSESTAEETASTDQSCLSVEKEQSEEDFFKARPCKCKEELDKFMKEKCTCEECNRIIRQSEATYVMGGTRETPSGNQVNIVQGIQQPQCGCLEKYQKDIRQMEEYKSRVMARYKMKKQPNKYRISGVKYTPEGPIYIVEGIRPPVQCACAKAKREQEEMEAYEKQRAKPPNTGRIKYEIQGVRAMPEENIYILSRALSIPPCDCQKLLERFEDAHAGCMTEWKAYLKLTEEEIGAFNDEMGNHQEEVQQSDSDIDNTLQNDDQIYGSHEEEPDLENNINEKVEEDESCEPEEDDCQSTNDESASRCSEEEDDDDEDETSGCGCLVDNPVEVKAISMPKDKLLEKSFTSKRFAIFRDMPKSKSAMRKIVKYILEGMAEDGFPLAKLPQVHKLPIFSLWIERRIGVYWGIEDKIKYSKERSTRYWNHMIVCYKAPIATKMPYTISEARKMTWRQANTIKAVAAQKSNEFYRKLKQTHVDNAREFFATTFSYEFPTSTWRDCAFAYLPTKEEDLFPYKVVQPHDAMNIPEGRRMNCYCENY